MNYKEVIVQFNQKKVKDYTFTVLFFIVFSIFIVFAIRPNIVTAIELRNELADLKNKDAEYEKLIQKIVEHQTILESQRTKLYVLDEAIPQKYLKQYTVIDDVNRSASQSGVKIVSLNLPEVQLVQKEQMGLQTVPIKVITLSEKENLGNLLKQFLEHRRIKQINGVLLEMSDESSNSANWESEIKFDTFYYKL